jgi:hypothetical protein
MICSPLFAFATFILNFSTVKQNVASVSSTLVWLGLRSDKLSPKVLIQNHVFILVVCGIHGYINRFWAGQRLFFKKTMKQLEEEKVKNTKRTNVFVTKTENKLDYSPQRLLGGQATQLRQEQSNVDMRHAVHRDGTGDGDGTDEQVPLCCPNTLCCQKNGRCACCQTNCCHPCSLFFIYIIHLLESSRHLIWNYLLVSGTTYW